MKMRKVAILLVAGLIVLPMALTNVGARPTVINVNYSGQSGQIVEDITLHIHGFGFPGEELDWEGTLVIPADQETQPSWTSSIVMTQASYFSAGVSGTFVLADSTNPDINGCAFDFAGNVYGTFELEAWYQANCPEIDIEPYTSEATVVINM